MTQHPNMAPVADLISAGAIVGSLVHILPPLAAFVALIWYCLQIYESETVQAYLQKRRIRRHYRKHTRHHKAKHPPEV